VRSQIFRSDADSKSRLVLILDSKDEVLDIVAVDITGCTSQSQICLETCTALLDVGSLVAGAHVLGIGSTGVKYVWEYTWCIIVGGSQRRLQRECWGVLRLLSYSAESRKVAIVFEVYLPLTSVLNSTMGARENNILPVTSTQF
jgi:hypothetical protein